MKSTTTFPEIDLSQLQTRMVINGERRAMHITETKMFSVPTNCTSKPLPR